MEWNQGLLGLLVLGCVWAAVCMARQKLLKPWHAGGVFWCSFLGEVENEKEADRIWMWFGYLVSLPVWLLIDYPEVHAVIAALWYATWIAVVYHKLIRPKDVRLLRRQWLAILAVGVALPIYWLMFTEPGMSYWPLTWYALIPLVANWAAIGNWFPSEDGMTYRDIM